MGDEDIDWAILEDFAAAAVWERREWEGEGLLELRAIPESWQRMALFCFLRPCRIKFLKVARIGAILFFGLCVCQCRGITA